MPFDLPAIMHRLAGALFGFFGNPTVFVVITVFAALTLVAVIVGYLQ